MSSGLYLAVEPSLDRRARNPHPALVAAEKKPAGSDRRQHGAHHRFSPKSAWQSRPIGRQLSG